MVILRAARRVLCHGLVPLRQAVAEGQYEYPRGLFFGDERLEEGPRVYQEFLTQRLVETERVVVIDVHTGVGKRGEDELLVGGARRSSPVVTELRRMFDGDVVPWDAENKRCSFRGGHYTAFPRSVPQATTYFLTQEFGTYSPIKVVHVLREENRWHLYGEARPDHPSKRRAKETFSPDSESWRWSVLRLGKRRLSQAMALAFGQTP